jgi:hypothetical protein
MSYADTYALTNDPAFIGRVQAAASEQALIFVNDERPEFNGPASLVIVSSANAYAFVSLVAAQPAISADSTDADILAALQAVWPQYGAALIVNEPAA